MSTVNVNPPTLGQITDDPRYNERNGLAASAAIQGTVWYVTGAPPNGLGGIGDVALRSDGGAGTTLYLKTAAATWTGRA